MFKLFSLLAALCVLSSTHLRSQTPSYYHYTSSDGLASSTVYDIIQDRNGFLWFATINGMSRFDGTRFTTYGTKDGLNSISIIALAEGRDGEIYIGNYEQGINVLRNGRIGHYCTSIDGKNFALSYLLLVPRGTSEQTLYAYRRWGPIASLTQNATGGLAAAFFTTSPVSINRLEILPNGEMIALTTSGLFTFKNGALARMHIAGLPDTNLYCFSRGDGGSFLIGAKGMIYKIKNNTVIKRYPVGIIGNNDVCAMLRDTNDNIWFSIMNRGFFLLSHDSDIIRDIGSTMGLNNTLVNNYLEDREGNIWISTFGKGAYCLNNLYIRSYDENDGLSNNSVYSIAKDKSGKLLLGTFNGINMLENGKFNRVHKASNTTTTENIFSIKNINDEMYVCGSFGGTGAINVSFQGMQVHLFNQPSFGKTRNGRFLFGTSANCVVVQRDINFKNNRSYVVYVFGDSGKINRINDIYEDTRQNVWIGTSLGLCKAFNLSADYRKAEWKKSFFPSDPVLNARISSITQDADDHVWFTGEKGIARYDLQTDSLVSYTDLMGCDLSSSTCSVADGKKRIWIGTMKGLYVYDGISVKVLNKQTGLPTNEILSLCVDGKTNILYIGTSNGISLLDLTMFGTYVPSLLNVAIISLKAGDSVYTNFSGLAFEPGQHHVFIGYKAISLSSPGSIRYKYILNGEVEETDRDYLDLLSLSAGPYELQIMARSQNNTWGAPVTLNFIVKPRFNETIWFRLGIFLIVVFFFASVAAWRFKLTDTKNQKELALTERINELKHQALSAMMNPHFIFNSLNSVQYLINCQRNEEANNYIAMMAKLVRKNLDTAGNAFIVLSEEILRLTLYLDLEKLRFQDNIEYEIITGTDVFPASIMIPNMIIQPFVENTLAHGIRTSDIKGKVTISFMFEDVDIESMISRSLIIKVADNGIGILEAKKHKRENHISKGIHIIEERLSLLSAKMQIPNPIMFDDLSSRNNDSHGTEVIISLPQPLYKIIDPKS